MRSRRHRDAARTLKVEGAKMAEQIGGGLRQSALRGQVQRCRGEGRARQRASAERQPLTDSCSGQVRQPHPSSRRITRGGNARARSRRRHSHCGGLGPNHNGINKAKRRRGTQRRAAGAGISSVGWARLDKNHQERLGSIEAPGVFREAANKVLETCWSYEKVNEMVKAVNAAPSEADKIEAVRSYGLSDDAPTTPLRGLADAWHRCHMATRSLLGVDDADMSVSLGRRTNADLQQLLDEFDELWVKVEHLRTLIGRRLASIDDVG